MRELPLLPSDQPIACSLDADGQAERVEEFRALFAKATARERHPAAAVITFPADADLRAAVEDITRREKQCCPFFDFVIDDAGGRLTLTITAPPDAAPLLDRLAGA